LRFRLEEFQSGAVDALVSRIGKARRDFAEDDECTAVGLTAPTGAGKTVIATALLERLFFGDGTHEPDPNLTVLWVTDDKSLNAQTINKITEASERIDAYRFRVLSDTDEPTLEPGFIYFTHIQQLQKNSTLHAVRNGVRSDHRTYGAWDMIANTVQQRGKDFVVVVDEAHRGATSAAERRTIVSTIMNGGTTNIGTQQPAAPVVLGISATPERFHTAMASAGRTLRNVEIPAADVRASGLLKDRILIKHVAEHQSADMTMLGLAVADLKAADEAWRAHHEATGDRLVEPLLVVQVEPGVTNAKLTEILATLESSWAKLSDLAVAHAFGDPHGPLTIGDKAIRYLAPEAISGDDIARVVLFKQALTTGWDCPRAEVLVSYANKDSYTEIAQLIGRLVRTPLAERVNGGSILNDVSAYLPGYRSEHVASVVKALTSDEAGDVEVRVVIAPVECQPNPIVPSTTFELLDTMASYMRPAAGFRSVTAQLLRLAALLNEHGILPGASAAARKWLVNQMRAAVDVRKHEVEEMEADNRALKVRTLALGIGATITEESSESEVVTAERDIDAYFSRAKRVLPDASANWYHADLCNNQGFDDTDAMVRVAAMAALGFKDTIEQQAAAQIESWRTEYAGTVSRKPRAIRNAIEPMWFLGTAEMIPTTVAAPTTVSAATQKVDGDTTKPVDTYPKHLYAIPAGQKDAGSFPVVTTGWEQEVLETELSSDSLAAWYRNPSSGKNSLAIPYTYGGTQRLLHPDFLFFHDDGDGNIAIDIVDPHRHDGADTAPKWAALAKYATDHPANLRRVAAVIRDSNGILRSLDLTLPGMAETMTAATDGATIELLFTEHGTRY
jgi:type III restriction enzyme